MLREDSVSSVQVCEILQSNEEGELEELLNLEVRTSLVIFPEKFQKIVNSGEVWFRCLQ